MDTSLLAILSRNWWLLLLRGLLAIAFGVAAFAWPGLTLVVLVLLWGAYAGLDGIMSLVAAIKGGTPLPRWWLVVIGLLGIGAAVACLLNPGMVGLLFVLIIGWFTIFRGILEIIGAIQLRKEIRNEGWLILSGILSILIGAIFVFRPGAGALAIVWIIAALAIVLGLALVLLAFRLRKHSRPVG